MDVKYCFLCKIYVLFDWQYVMYVTNLKAFYISLNTLNVTP